MTIKITLQQAIFVNIQYIISIYLLLGNTSDGSYTEKRFKFLCKAPSPEQIKLSVAREEERYCTSQGTCSRPLEEEEGWEPWGPWGDCSAPCGGGQQARNRRCRKPPCTGPKDMLRACNTKACSGGNSSLKSRIEN